VRRVWLFLLLASGGAHADDGWLQGWSRLWQSADQRGEQLLRQGDAAAAARTYSDPRRRAYAELQAGDYPAAARDFAVFDDGDAHYNRGNALAHAGDLEAALKAYDAALARDPGNRDARRNRDLVARALRQRPPPKQSGGSGQAGQPAGRQDKSAGESGGGGQDKGTAGKFSSGQGGQAGRQGGEKYGQALTGAAGQQPPADQGHPGTGAAQRPGADSAAQARRDAEAGLGRSADRNAGQPATQAPSAFGELPDRADARGGERKLAQEQWLRQIPDDPGGLLRRKFMIEHLMRQQGNTP